MTPQVTVAIAIHVAILLVGAYDLWAGFAHGTDATVTAVIRQWSGKWPILPFAAGVLCGHLFGW